MRGAVRMLGSLGLGAALMYVFDPRLGRRRRKVIYDQVKHAMTAERKLMGKARRDLEHRVHGVAHDIRDPRDPAIAQRVHAAIDHVAPHQDRMSPGPRVLVGGSGALLALLGGAHGGLTGKIAKLGGATLLVRAIANRRLDEVIGLRPATIEVEKTLTIHAPVDHVFALWTQLDTFPRFMQHVRNVQISVDDPQQSKWVVDGPFGIEACFDAKITQLEKNRSIAWTTLPGSDVEHSGTIRFDEVDGGTRVQIHLRYQPPAGVLGATLARLFGTDPKARLDDDLVRAKTLLEQGRTRAHHQRVSLEELKPVDRPPEDRL